MADATLTIGQVAAKAGINVSAIRYYERYGLMPKPERAEVEALIDGAEQMRRWLTTATACGCDTLDACALFTNPPDAPTRSLRPRQVG
jgi:MerR-like DNA binding protein